MLVLIQYPEEKNKSNKLFRAEVNQFGSCLVLTPLAHIVY